MSNRHVIELMDDYLRGGLDPESRTRVEAHLLACHSCRRALDSAGQSSAIMRWLPPPEAAPTPGPDFYYRVMDSIEREQRRGWLMNWAAGLHPRLAVPFLAMGLLLLAWVVSLPRNGQAWTSDGWDEVEYPAADFAAMLYSDDSDAARHDRMMDDLFDTAEVE